TPVQRLVCYLVELYADEFLILPGLHYRWSFPESETRARQDFAIMTGDPRRANRFADQVKTFAQLIGVRPETGPAIEAHTRELLASLEAIFETQRYLLGGRPSLADCALMGPLYAHLYMDAVPARLLRETAPLTCQWIERMNHPDPDGFGAWLAGDAPAPPLRRLLELIGRDAIPLVLDTVRACDAWADGATPGAEELPRGVGMHRTALRGVDFERFTLSYTLWMVQRVQAAHMALDVGGRTAVRSVLTGTGCTALLACSPRHRLVRRPFKLLLEPRGGAGRFLHPKCKKGYRPSMGRKILFITTDQQRYDALGCNGGTVARTPVADRLAATGVNYRRAHNQNVVCMPARSTMVTGQYVRTHGVVANGV